MPLRNLSESQILGICGTFAAFCGMLSYLLKVEEGKPFKWREFLLHTLISGVFGLITYEVLAFEGFPPQLAGALCGVAGWGGTRVAKIVELLLPKLLAALVRKKLGVTKEDLEGK